MDADLSGTTEAHSLGEILDGLAEQGREQDQVSVDDMKKAVGQRSYGPFLLVPALLEMSPIGGIPGLPTVIALLIVIVAVQMLLGRDHLWIPGFLGRRSVEGERLEKATDKMRGIAGWADRLFHGRLTFMTRGIWVRIIALLCILLCLTVPGLELIPFASTFPMAAIALFGMALLVGDGLLVLLGLAVVIGGGIFGLTRLV